MVAAAARMSLGGGWVPGLVEDSKEGGEEQVVGQVQVQEGEGA